MSSDGRGEHTTAQNERKTAIIFEKLALWIRRAEHSADNWPTVAELNVAHRDLVNTGKPVLTEVSLLCKAKSVAWTHAMLNRGEYSLNEKDVGMVVAAEEYERWKEDMEGHFDTLRCLLDSLWARAVAVEIGVE